MFDALRMAAYNGLDVRLLLPLRSDKIVAAYAARYVFDDLLSAGARVYLYRRGMMHSKMLLFDDEVAAIGSSNFDNRSFRLNFEIMCMIYTAAGAESVQCSMERDFAESDEVDLAVFRQRSTWGRLAENACRLLSPIL
ncbi:MAG: phospholipase D-like domain-containing protein [Gemmataceae bacterium]